MKQEKPKAYKVLGREHWMMPCSGRELILFSLERSSKTWNLSMVSFIKNMWVVSFIILEYILWARGGCCWQKLRLESC